jgi:DNA-binding transcriptional regulator YiaG
MTPAEMKEARQALGMTQKQLAEALELDGPYAKHTVRSWENGKRGIGGPVRVAIRLLLKHQKPKRAKPASEGPANA